MLSITDVLLQPAISLELLMCREGTSVILCFMLYSVVNDVNRDFLEEAKREFLKLLCYPLMINFSSYTQLSVEVLPLYINF